MPPEIDELVQEAAKRLEVDGVVLVFGRARYLQYADVIHWVATLTASIYYSMLRGNTVSLGVEVLLPQPRGRVWSARTTVYQIGQIGSTAVKEPASARYGPALFEAFPPARPLS